MAAGTKMLWVIACSFLQRSHRNAFHVFWTFSKVWFSLTSIYWGLRKLEALMWALGAQRWVRLGNSTCPTEALPRGRQTRVWRMWGKIHARKYRGKKAWNESLRMKKNALARWTTTTNERSISDTRQNINKDNCQEKGPEHGDRMDLGNIEEAK